VPVITALRSNKFMEGIPISVDTFYSTVAEAAITAGANIINDVHAGTFDENILQVAAKHKTPIILMHMRGTPKTMTQPQNMEYDDVLDEVVTYLRQRALVAQDIGIPAWNIILDPGLGFAKTHEHSLEILRRYREFRLMTAPYATMVGTSRKGFIGQVISQPVPKNRGWGTAATSAIAVAGGVNILRVHDVPEQRDVALVAGAIYPKARGF